MTSSRSKRHPAAESLTTPWLRADPFLALETAFWIISAEALCDLYAKWRFAVHHNPLSLLLHAALGILHISPIFEFAINWLVPVVIICAIVGYRSGKAGAITALAATGLFLLVLHSFRGVAERHNVFVFAQMWHRWHTAGVAAPWVWDAMYVVAAPLAAVAGMHLARRRPPAGESAAARLERLVSGRGMLLAGIACLVVGAVEARYTVSIAWPNDSLIGMPRITHFAAVLACGVVGVTSRWWKGPVEE